MQPPTDDQIDPALRNAEIPGGNTVRVFGSNVTNLAPALHQSQLARPTPTATPSRTSSLQDINSTSAPLNENIPPPSSQRKTPKPPIVSQAALEKAKNSISLVPKKRSFERAFSRFRSMYSVSLFDYRRLIAFIERVF